MPEAPEVDTDKLRETIDDEIERKGGNLLRSIALTTSLLAAFAAVAALEAGDTVNEALILKTESTRLQAQASDQWTYYQAKGIKSAVAEASESPYRSLGKDPPAEVARNAARYASEQEDIKRKAEELEHERDAKSAEADHLLHRHHGFADAVALFQVAIALGAVAALTRARLMWVGSIGLGGVGVAVFVAQFLR